MTIDDDLAGAPPTARTFLEAALADVTAAGGNRRVEVSFEFYPPVAASPTDSLWRCVEQLQAFTPRYVSVTYGAGGGTQDRTLVQLERIVAESSLAAAGHLTCVGRSRGDVDRVIDHYLELGVHHIVALRGDPPEGTDDGRHPEGYHDAADLVAGIRRRSDIAVAVAAYPEVHPRAASPEADLDNLKRKIDAGADVAVTQFFFDTAVYEGFVEGARRAGIEVPIVPGIMPVASFERVAGFAARCGASVPDWLRELFDGLDDQPSLRNRVAALVTARQVAELVDLGVESVHLYTMNQPDLTADICRLLGLGGEPSGEGSASS